MPLLNVVIILIVVGFLLWLFNNYVTMIDAKIKQIINIVVLVAVVIWLLSLFLRGTDLGNIRVGQLMDHRDAICSVHSPEVTRHVAA